MIVVGVDGSRAGLEAVGWAVREAALRRAGVRMVHAVPKWSMEMSETVPYAEVGRWMRECAAGVLAEAVERAAREGLDVAVESECLPGDPRPVLIESAGDAELLVVGNHGLGGFRGLLVGSVALGITGRAPCPVVMVSGAPAVADDTDEAAPAGPAALPHGEVVVGVDGSDGGSAAIGFAFAEAALRGAELRAVHAWNHLAPGAGFDPIPVIPEEGAERRLLAQALAGWRERYPSVKVTEQADRGHPVDVLRNASAHADLLVVGSRGRGGMTGLILGSVSHAVLHHASGPVAVVPDGWQQPVLSQA
ncbi:universal stress protein [Streptosporangium sp. KLBMP 9127]|nr:universal stress protein [Streptosporangium sp. KLBMP 9127]